MDRLQGFQGRSSSIRRVIGAIFVFGSLVFASCSRSSTPDNRIRLTETPKAMAATATTPPDGPPECPPSTKGGDVPKVTPNHRVILTWNPSSSSSGANDTTVFYCLYRMDENDGGNIPNDLKRKDLHHCPDCQRVNQKAVPGIGCVDTRVKDGAIYLYWAGAIRKGSDLSEFSAGTSATIRPNPNAPPQGRSYPECWP